MKATKPNPDAIARIQKHVEKYRAKTGTTGHPNPEVTEGVVQGLAANVEEVGRATVPLQLLCKQTNKRSTTVDAGFVPATK